MVGNRRVVTYQILNRSIDAARIFKDGCIMMARGPVVQGPHAPHIPVMGPHLSRGPLVRYLAFIRGP